MEKCKELLSAYIEALYPIIYINHFDFKIIDELLLSVGKGVNIIEYNNGLCEVDFNTKKQVK